MRSKVSSVTTGAKTPPTEACRGCGNVQMLARDEHALVAAEQVLSLCPKIYLPLNSRSHSFSNATMLSNLGGSDTLHGIERFIECLHEIQTAVLEGPGQSGVPRRFSRMTFLPSGLGEG